MLGRRDTCAHHPPICKRHAHPYFAARHALASPMPRAFTISVAPDQTESVLQRLDKIEGVIGLACHRGASLRPRGDLIEVDCVNEAVGPLLDRLGELGVVEGGSVRGSAPRLLLSRSEAYRPDREPNETSWEEMAQLLREDTNLRANFLLLMALAGGAAAAGLWSDTLHLVIGAMVIAPAFEPLVRIPFGLLVGQPVSARRGLVSALLGYALVALSGWITGLVLRLVDPASAETWMQGPWVAYWSSFSAGGIAASVFGAMAGAIVVTGHRSVLTTGVMIALALVPSITLVGLALSAGEIAIAGRAFARWAADAALVLTLATVVLGLKQRLLHRRRALG